MVSPSLGATQARAVAEIARDGSYTIDAPVVTLTRIGGAKGPVSGRRASRQATPPEAPGRHSAADHSWRSCPRASFSPFEQVSDWADGCKDRISASPAHQQHAVLLSPRAARQLLGPRVAFGGCVLGVAGAVRVGGSRRDRAARAVGERPFWQPQRRGEPPTPRRRRLRRTHGAKPRHPSPSCSSSAAPPRPVRRGTARHASCVGRDVADDGLVAAADEARTVGSTPTGSGSRNVDSA